MKCHECCGLHKKDRVYGKRKSTVLESTVMEWRTETVSLIFQEWQTTCDLWVLFLKWLMVWQRRLVFYIGNKAYNTSFRSTRKSQYSSTLNTTHRCYPGAVWINTAHISVQCLVNKVLSYIYMNVYFKPWLLKISNQPNANAVYSDIFLLTGLSNPLCAWSTIFFPIPLNGARLVFHLSTGISRHDKTSNSICISWINYGNHWHRNWWYIGALWRKMICTFKHALILSFHF